MKLVTSRETEILSTDALDAADYRKAAARKERIMKSARDATQGKFHPNAQNCCDEPGMDQEAK